VFLNRIFATKEEDCYYFLYNFLCRSWILLNSLIFCPMLSAVIFDFSITMRYFIYFFGVYLFVVFIDGIRVYLKWWKMNKELAEMELNNFGHKKYH